MANVASGTTIVVENLVTRVSWTVDRAAFARAVGALNAVRAAAGRAAIGIGRAGVRAGQAATGIGAMSAAAAGAGRNMLMMARSWVIGGFAVMTVGRAVFGAIVELEKLETTLGTVLGSQRLAAEAFDRLLQFAARTPFTIDQVISAFIRMNQTTEEFKTMPFEEVERIMTGLGDLASAVGDNIDNLILGAQRAVAGRTQRLQQALKTAIEKNGNTLRIMFRGVAHEIDVTDGNIVNLLRGLAELGETEFGGAMERQMQTVAGAFSNLSDIVKITMRSLGKGGLRDSMFAFVLGAREMFIKLNEFGGAIGKILAVPIRLLGFAIDTVTSNLTFLKIVLGGFSLLAMARAVQLILALLRQAVVLFGLLNAPLIAWAGIILLIEDFVGFMQGKESVIGAFVEEFQGVEGIVGDFSRLLIMLRDDLPHVLEALKNSFESIAGAISSTWEDAKSFFEGIIDFGVEAADTFVVAADALGRMVTGRRLNELSEQREEQQGALEHTQQQLASIQARLNTMLLGTEFIPAEELQELLTRQAQLTRAEPLLQRSVLDIEEQMRQALVAFAPALTAPIPALPSPGAVLAPPRGQMFFSPGARPGTMPVTVTTGDLAVNVQGTTGMNSAQLLSAFSTGVNDALRQPLRQAARLLGAATETP